MADLAALCSLLALQLLDLTHRGWSETEGLEIEEGDVFTLATAAQIGIKLHSTRRTDPPPFLRPDLRQRACSLTDLLTVLAATLGRRQLPPLHAAQAVREVVTKEYHILETLNYGGDEFHASSVHLFETRFSLNVLHLRQRFPQGAGSLLSLLIRASSEVLASTALRLASDFARDRQVSLEALPGLLVFGLSVSSCSSRALCLWPLVRASKAGSFHLHGLVNWSYSVCV